MPRPTAYRTAAFAMLLSAAAFAAPPASRPATEPSDRPALEAEQASLPHHAPLSIRQILTFDLDHDFIHTTAVMPPSDDKFGIDIVGWPGFATGQFRVGGTWFTLNHFALLDDDNTEINTYVDLRPDYLQINYTIESTAQFTSMTLIQSQQNADESGDVVSFVVQDQSKAAGDAAPALNLRFTAATATDLIRAHPTEMRKYLLPALRSLSAERVMRATDTATAWQVLGDRVAVDPALSQQIDALLGKLDADDFAARTKAADDLIALGPAGAAALRQRPLGNLGPDPKSSVENALRHNQPLTTDAATELSRNLPFLIDALLLDEPRLVQAAADRLKELTGYTPVLPANLSAEERARRVDAFRAAVIPTTRPATH